MAEGLIIRKTNLAIVLLFIQNFSYFFKFLTELTSSKTTIEVLNFGLFLAQF